MAQKRIRYTPPDYSATAAWHIVQGDDKGRILDLQAELAAREAECRGLEAALTAAEGRRAWHHVHIALELCLLIALIGLLMTK